MDETKVQIGEDVLIDIGIHSDWYISSMGYNGESVSVDLRRKADQHKEWWLADAPQTDLLVKTPRKSRESHEKNCETCRDKDAYDEWQGNCDERENGSMYTPQTESLEQFRVGLEYHTDTTHFGKTKGESVTTNKTEAEPQAEEEILREQCQAFIGIVKQTGGNGQ